MSNKHDDRKTESFHDFVYLYIGVVCPCLTQMTSVTRSVGVGGVMLHGKYATMPATASTFVVITEKIKKIIIIFSRFR